MLDRRVRILYLKQLADVLASCHRSPTSLAAAHLQAIGRTLAATFMLATSDHHLVTFGSCLQDHAGLRTSSSWDAGISLMPPFMMNETAILQHYSDLRDCLNHCGSRDFTAWIIDSLH